MGGSRKGLGFRVWGELGFKVQLGCDGMGCFLPGFTGFRLLGQTAQSAVEVS